MSNRPGETTYPSADEWKRTQEHRLQQLLAYLSANSPFYRELFKKSHIDATAIRTLEDLQRLPTTCKEDLQLRNDDFLCVPRNKIAEYTSTSGTAGKPVTIALTEHDLNRLAQNEYGSFLCADGSADELYHLMLTLDRQFMAGIAYYSGIRRLGAGIIRLGPGLPSMQWETIQRLKPTSIVAVPSFILKLVQFAEQQHIDINGCSVKKAVCIGENIRNNDFSFNNLGRRIKDAWDLRLYSTYASTEMQTAFTECREGKGGHLQPELLIVELLDESGRKVGPNTPGEVTITTLGVEGMPLLRYKTGDICLYFDEPCSCGRTSLRLSPVIGRKNQMIKFKGTTFYPPALFDVLNEMEEVTDFVVEICSDENGLDEVVLHLVPAVRNDEYDHRIRANLKAKLRASPSIIYVSAEEVQRIQFPVSGRKAVKFIDRRR
ncbi:MAG TPA: AMP-binding protein [Puia sp.]|nr:AMP-binding protein [Puia sp.]